MQGAPLTIEIVYAEAQRAVVKMLSLPAGSRLADAVRAAAADADFAGVDFATSAVGIFGRLVRADHALQDGDRIEIYRPLAEDPKAARRARVKQARKKT